MATQFSTLEQERGKLVRPSTLETYTGENTDLHIKCKTTLNKNVILSEVNISERKVSFEIGYLLEFSPSPGL